MSHLCSYQSRSPCWRNRCGCFHSPTNCCEREKKNSCHGHSCCHPCDCCSCERHPSECCCRRRNCHDLCCRCVQNSTLRRKSDQSRCEQRQNSYPRDCHRRNDCRHYGCLRHDFCHQDSCRHRCDCRCSCCRHSSSCRRDQNGQNRCHDVRLCRYDNRCH